MSQAQKHIVVSEPDHQKGAKLALRWKGEGLGTLTYGDIFRAGLLVLEVKILALAKASKGK